MRNKIIEILRNSSIPIRGKELASKLNVSDRTIRNYINDINSTKKIIKSNQQGYSLVEMDSAIAQYSENPYSFQNQDERVLLIIEKIISSKDDSDLYDIAEALYISYSTIEKDVQLIKKIISSYNLQFMRSKGKVAIIGNESDKRLLINTLLRESNNININQLIDDMATDIDVNIVNIKKILLEEVTKNHLYVNDYAIKNIIIHVIIALSRIKNNNLLKDRPNKYDYQDMNLEIKCANDFIERLQTKYSIKFNDIEREQLIFLIISKISRVDSDLETKYIVKDNYISFTKKVIEQINQLYYIDLNDTDFINFFSIHLENVIFRCKNETYNKNPLANNIYIQNPLIYDIATCIASQITLEFDCTLNRDEITFIALHVGAVIEKNNNKKKKLEAILLINDYYYFEKDIFSKIEDTIGKTVNITVMKELNRNYDIFKFDFIINTIQSNLDIKIPIINTSPFLNQKDIKKIESFIDRFDEIKKKQHIQKIFKDFFSKDRFEINHYENDADEMISYMADQLFEDNLVTVEFKDAVLKREHLTPTSFDNKIAIPHSIFISAKKNCAYVIINNKSMKWGYFDINIIILLGINHAERNKFKELYENLLELIEGEHIINKIIHVKSYEDFINELIS